MVVLEFQVVLLNVLIVLAAAGNWRMSNGVALRMLSIPGVIVLLRRVQLRGRLRTQLLRWQWRLCMAMVLAQVAALQSILLKVVRSLQSASDKAYMHLMKAKKCMHYSCLMDDR